MLFFSVLFIAFLLIGLCHQSRNEKKKVSVPPVYVREPTLDEVREKMFDLSIENLLRTKYQNSFSSWKYQEDTGEEKRKNSVNPVVIYLTNGLTVTELINTNDVIDFKRVQDSPDDEKKPEDSGNESDPVEEWITIHAADIATKVEKFLENGYLSIIYTVDEGYLSVIADIAEKLNDRTPYEVSVEKEKLKVNFESLLIYE